MHIEIPDDLGVTEEQARLDFAVGLYTSRSANLARAARLAGLSRIDFQRILAERAIPLIYNSVDLNDDVDTVFGPISNDDTALSPEAEAEARALGLDPANISPLGRELLHLRAKGIAEGMHLSSWEELDAEMAEMRGEDEGEDEDEDEE